MGYGRIVNGKHTPITPWQGSWAQQQQAKRDNPQVKPDGQWPLGHPLQVRPFQTRGPK